MIRENARSVASGYLALFTLIVATLIVILWFISAVEAESVAYLVMSYLGLDFSLSKAYVANYKAGIGEARSSLIIRTADKMIKGLKKVMSDEEQFLVALSN